LFTADFSSDDCSRTVMDTNGLNNQICFWTDANFCSVLD
jgi:hypothetical protein